MSTLYIYNVDTMDVVATHEIDSNCKDQQAAINDIMFDYDQDQYAATFTPAFGFNGGLNQ